MHQTTTSILCIYTNHVLPPLSPPPPPPPPPPQFSMWTRLIPIAIRAAQQQIRLIDNLHTGHVDNV